MLKTKFQVFLAGALTAGVIGLTGCGGGGGAAGTTPPSTTPTAASIILASSTASIKTDGSNSTTITANVVDTNNLPVPGATVKFSATGGTLGVSSGVSSTSGIVTISYSAISPSGSINAADRTETVTATVVGTNVSAQIPIKVASTALVIILGSSSASIKPDGSTSTTITANVVDVYNLPVSGVTVKFSASSGTLGTSSGVSSAAGAVTIPYSAVSPTGVINMSDRTETVTATVVGATASAQIPIKVSSSSLLISLATSNATVKSDGSNSATITATVTDPNNIAVPGATVTFTKGTGQLGTSSGLSSGAGIVTIPYSAVAFDKTTGAPIDKTNRTETITATVAGTTTTAQIPIQVVGSILAITPSLTTVPAGGTVTLTASAKDASQTGVAGQSLRFTIPAGKGTLSGGSGTATSQLATSLSNGATPAITFTPAVAGNVPVTVDWLNAAGNVSLTSSTAINVTVVGVSFAMTLPASNATALPLALGATQAISVSVPANISNTAVASVRFSTTLGTWSNTTKVSTVVPVANAVNEVLAGGNSSGTASVQIEALDVSGKTLATLNQSFALSAPATAAGAITLQSSISNVPPSAAGSSNSATLTATVRTSGGGNTVGGAAVLFEIMNPTGSGEQISPVVARTDSSGQAVATFTSGSQSTVGGLKIKASVVGTAANCDNSVSPPLPGICDVKAIFVNASGVSVSLGYASVISSVDNNTNYQLPMSVLVVDNAGTAVKNALVTLSAFPTQYFAGFRDHVTCAPTYNLGYPKANEDINENDNLDPGEDVNADGAITPAHSTAGTVPSTVTTDANGVATFNLTYQKQYASWIQDRVRAKVVVSTGTTESTNELKFILPYAQADTKDCTLSNSPGGW
ncbi:MAG: Ig-like domain-containing protein [Proteobacteria bacterium]|nr:Ig-like domain-containing protein [Pseudomonadota bacterium]